MNAPTGAEEKDMGYTTTFIGKFTLDKPLKPEHAAYLRAFAGSRRMKRNPAIAETLPDPVRLAASLPIGEEGGYYVGGADADFGQARDASVTDYNRAPIEQPSLWCQWIPTKDGNGIEWDEGEKFYCYVEWLEYLIAHFLAPWGYLLNGDVYRDGEDPDDFGRIRVTDNVVVATVGRRVYD